MGQKIEIDKNGKIALLTDNGKLCNGETTTDIHGTFTCEAEVAAAIYANVNNLCAAIECPIPISYLLENSFPVNSGYKEYSSIRIYTNDEKIKELIDRLETMENNRDNLNQKDRYPQYKISELKDEITSLNIKLGKYEKNWFVKMFLKKEIKG